MRLRVALLAITGAAFAATSANAQQPTPGRGGGGGRGTTIGAGESCPPGSSEIRPRLCREPEFPAPSIVDYRPHSTLVTAEHKVPKAKYPAIDYHAHIQEFLRSAEALERLGPIIDSLGVKTMYAADVVSGDRLKTEVALVKASPTMKDRVRILTGINFNGVGPGWAEKAVKQLDDDIAAGAVGVGEIMKSFGTSIKKPDGSRLHIDDPELDPIWEEAARLKIPVFIHTADPQEFYEPLDYKNERWLEMALFSDRRYPPDRYPRFEELMGERDRLFKKHPKTTFVAAHFAWEANDLGRLAKLLTECPNVNVELGAVLYDIGRQPRAAHDFFMQFQDRILFGKDSFQPEEYPYYWRVFETKDEYFDYYRGYHAFWKLYGIDLPDEVLKKVYYKNALRITPLAPQSGYPK